MRRSMALALVACLLLAGGCQLNEIRSKSKFGPEIRHSGSSSTQSERWTIQQGIELKWDKGVSTGFTYRRRDVAEGSGDRDNGFWFDFSFPLWKRQKEPSAQTHQIEALEARLATLESKLNQEQVQK